MAILSIHKETALPGTLAAHSIYLIAPPAKPNFIEIYVTDASAVAKRVIDETEVQALIDASISGLSLLTVVADITARDALGLATNGLVLVTDASADVTVAAGAATYIYDQAADTFTKIAEYESLDITLDWGDIQNGPAAAVADIDDAVSKRHAHANKTQLDKIGEDGNGDFTYDGALPKTAWGSTGW